MDCADQLLTRYAACDRWTGCHRTDWLRLIDNNSRFLILPEHHYPNLISRILSACPIRLVDDRHRHFGKL